MIPQLQSFVLLFSIHHVFSFSGNRGCHLLHYHSKQEVVCKSPNTFVWFRATAEVTCRKKHKYAEMRCKNIMALQFNEQSDTLHS